MVKVIITDDHKLFRQILCGTLQEFNIETIAEAENGLSLLEILKTMVPDIVLLDVQMPFMDGCEAFEHIKKLYPDLKVIFLTTHSDKVLAEHLYSKGVQAFLDKNCDIERVAEVIHAVHTNTYFHEYQSQQVYESEKFSKREAQIAMLICDGKSNKEIAEALQLNEKTVESFKSKLFIKTKTQSSVQFVSYILKKGLNYLK